MPYAPWGYLEELLFTRNGPELLLGGTNPSIVGQNVSQMERLREGISPRLLSYTDDLSDKYDETEFTDMLLLGLNAEYRLSRFQNRPYLFSQ